MEGSKEETDVRNNLEYYLRAKWAFHLEIQHEAL